MTPRLLRARTKGTWEARGVVIQTPPEAEVQENIATKGWSNRRIVCTCQCVADAEFIAELVNERGAQ